MIALYILSYFVVGLVLGYVLHRWLGDDTITISTIVFWPLVSVALMVIGLGMGILWIYEKIDEKIG